jgi:hypothetical protein
MYRPSIDSIRNYTFVVLQNINKENTINHMLNIVEVYF